MRMFKVCDQARPLMNVMLGAPWFTTQANAVAAMEPWLDRSWISPPVGFGDGREPPTALSWLRRHGPDIPESFLQRVFRERQIRVFDGEKVKRVKKSVQMGAGFKLLVPKHCLQGTGTENGSKQVKKKVSTLHQGAEEWTWEKLWKRRLYEDGDMIVFNKPAGLATKMGVGVRVSVASLMKKKALEKGWEPFRLVHQLDKNTSGALILAKSADSAAWISEAFQEKSAKGETQTRRKQFLVRKLYWAIVEHGHLLERRGTVKHEILIEGNKLPAQTVYWCKETSHGLALLKLMPITGRKNQIQIHCAFGLSSPIIGDSLHGRTRNQLQIQGIASMKNPKDTISKLHLHAGGMIIGKPGKKPIKLIVPPPDHFINICKSLGWKQQLG